MFFGLLSPCGFQIFHLRKFSCGNRRCDQRKQNRRDYGVIEIVLEQIEAFGGGDPSAKEVEAVGENDGGGLKVGRSGADSARLSNRLEIKIVKFKTKPKRTGVVWGSEYLTSLVFEWSKVVCSWILI